MFLEICTSIRCIRTLGGYLLALAFAEPTSQHAALPSQPLTLRLPFGKISFESPRYQRPLRRLLILSHSGQATERQLLLCSFLNIFQLQSFGIIGDSDTCPSPESYRMPQAQWTLNCQNCNRVFAHSEVDTQSHTLPYDELWPYRPEVPEGGLKTICPHCHEPGLYERFQLTLRPLEAATFS